MKCPLALSLRVTPIPSRTTQKSTRPRASDRPMCCQPGNRHGLPASEIDRRRHYSIKMHEMEARNPTQHLVSRTGAERQGNIFSFQSREKNVLDFSSYRPGVIATLRLLFARQEGGKRKLVLKRFSCQTSAGRFTWSARTTVRGPIYEDDYQMAGIRAHEWPNHLAH